MMKEFVSEMEKEAFIGALARGAWKIAKPILRKGWMPLTAAGATIIGPIAGKEVIARRKAARLGQLKLESPRKGTYRFDAGPISLFTLPFSFFRG